MTYGECFGTGIGESGKIITADTVLEVAAIDESINGDGGLTLGWNSTTGGGLAVGTAIGKYVLLQPYVPTKNSDGSYRYEVKFSDPIALLGKKLFYKMVTVLDKAGNSTQTPLYTFSFVGKASTIIGALAQAGGVSCDASNMADSGTISVSFDGDSIKSAAEKIGSACDLAVWYTEGCIHFGSSVNFISGEYYNHFVVLGGTKNMTKKIVTSEGEEYAAVTQRLTLDPTQYPGSVIGSGTPEMTKLLVFDNIYPKARLKVTHVYRRECWMLNEAGDKIPTAWQGEGENRVATAWKKYTKWYVRLGDADGEGHIDQSNLERLIVDGTTLRMQFLPFAEGGTSVLAGREFELVHFNGSDPVKEKEDDDVDPNGFMAQPGMYRIVMTADCNTLLPSDDLPPAVGDLVTLVNIAVPDTCYTKAREELLAAGEAVAAMYGVTVPAPESYTGGGGASIGETSGGYLVTNVHTDLITGEVQVTYGTLAQRGMIASLIDKVDGVQTAGGGGTTGTSGGQGVGTMSSEQWNALAQAGGRTGLVTINNRIERVANQVQTYGTDLAQVQSQADQKMQMWFGTYAPTAANYPSVEWVTDAEKQLHVEDIFYDYSREAADPDGGKAWRWTRHEETVNGETVVTYSWDEVTDAETLLAIEKASDIASDGKITGGAEKVRLYNEWLRVVDEHTKYNALHTAYGLNVNRYNIAYSMLAQTLNGGEPFTSGTPSWVASLSSTTNILFDDDFLELAAFQYLGLHVELTDLVAASREVYRNVWARYYEEADALDRASKVTANDAFQNVKKLADDGIISAGWEKSQLLTLWRETVAEFWKYLEQAEDYDLQKETVNPNTNLNTYRSYVLAYVRVAEMLNDDEQGTIDYTDYINSATYKFSDNIPDLLIGASLPLWLGSDTTHGFGKDTLLSDTETGTAATYRTKWNNYYMAKAILLKAIEAKVKGATDMAQTTADTAQTMAQTVMDTISAAVYDNLLDEDDLETLNGEFEALIYDADSVLERTYTPLGVSLSGVGQLRSQLITAIQVIGTLLNIDPESPESNHNWTFIYNDVSRSVTVNGITSTVYFPEIDKEDTLGANIPYLLDEAFEYSEAIAINGATFLDAWSDYYSIRADLLTAIAKVAERGVYDASDLLSGIADDKRIMQNEKNDLLKQWQAWAAEYAVLMSAKNDSTINADAKWAVYETKLYRLAHFLKDLTDSTTAITVATFEPTMLMTQGITVLTVAQATLYKTVLREFRTARTDLLTALSTGKMNYWVSPFLPANGFYVGDRCIWKNHLADGTYESVTDTTMICVKQHDASYVYRQQTWDSETSDFMDSETANAETDNGSNWFDYWKEASTVIGEIVRDPRQQLATLADRLYTLYGSDSTHFPITIQLTDNGNSVTLNSGSYTSDDAVESCLTQIQDIIGNISFSICLSTPIQPVHYDMLCVPVTCSIPGGNGESVTGGIQIKMYNGTEWEYIQESTSSLLESLGNKILAMVFGSNAAATEAAGLSVGQRFAKLFAMAEAYDPDNPNADENGYVTLSQALFGLEVTPSNYVNIYDSTDTKTASEYNSLSESSKANYAVLDYTSSTKMRADKIDFTAGSFNIDARHIDFTGYTFSVDAANITLSGSPSQGFQNAVAASGVVLKSDMAQFGLYSNGAFVSGVTALLVNSSTGVPTTTLNLTGNNVNIDAERINFKTGNFHVSYGNVNTFEIDAYGLVTMRDATLSGVLTSTGSRTSIKIDATDGNATDTAMKMSALVSANGSTVEKQVLKVGIEDYTYENENCTEGIIKLGTTDDGHPGRMAIMKPQKQIIGGNSYTTVIKPGHYYMYWHGEGGASTLIDGETVRYYAYLKLMIDEDGVHTYNIGNSPERYQWDNSSSDHGRAAFVAAVIDPA